MRAGGLAGLQQAEGGPLLPHGGGAGVHLPVTMYVFGEDFKFVRNSCDLLAYEHIQQFRNGRLNSNWAIRCAVISGLAGFVYSHQLDFMEDFRKFRGRHYFRKQFGKYWCHVPFQFLD